MTRTKKASKHLVMGRNGSDKNESNELLSQNVPSTVKVNILKRCFYDPVHKRKVLHSVWIAVIFISLGMAFGQSGPTLLDLQIITKTDLEASSFFLTATSVGYLAGSVLCGVIYDRVNKNLFLLSGVIGLGLFSIATPYCFNFIAMIFIRAIVGIFIGVVDAAGNAEQMRVWGNEGHELMQMLHFCFAIGGVLSPLYSEPFLAHKEIRNTTLENVANLTDQTTIPSELKPETTDIQYAYIITGIFCIVSGIPWLIIYVQDKLGTSKIVIKADGAVTQRNVPLPILLYMIFMLSVMYLLYCCAEVSFSSFLMTFLVEEFDESKSKGAHVTAVFWALFAASRFFMIFISQVLSAVQLLYISCILMVITSVCFTISAAFASIDAIVAFTALLGLSISAIFPAGFSWTESQLMRVTSRISACILVSSSIGGMISPLILSNMMERIDNMWFCYLMVIEIVLMCIVFIILFVSAKFFINKRYIFENDIVTNGDAKPSEGFAKV
uniref:Major facilitator superfamily (MFS) profile domain-containing protein n=2 Tax=Arion vulgaris TaxID=1028688 RepID=A0A0B7A6Q1_9EUPU